MLSKMDLEIPYLRIRDFESQTLEKLLNKERRLSRSAYDHRKVEIDMEDNSSRRSVYYTGDCYSKSVDLILETIGLEKYIENFKAYDIGVNILVHMDEDDLAEIGITSYLDQELFIKQLRDFRGSRNRMNYVGRVEEDLIMAQNICTHLEDINHHLNVVQNYLKKNKYEDYYVSPKKSILSIFNIVMERALVQTKKMKDELFTGSFDSDELIPSFLKADSLELPEFMIAKLYKPDKNFKVKKQRNISFLKAMKVLAGLSVALSSLGILILRGK